MGKEIKKLETYYQSAMPFYKCIIMFLYLAVMGIIVILCVMHVLDYGWQKSIEMLMREVQLLQWQDMISIVIVIGVFVIIYYLPLFILRGVIRRDTAFVSSGVCILRNGKEMDFVPYEKIAMLIRKRRLYVKNGRIYIPCPNEDVYVRLYNNAAHFPTEAFCKISALSGKKLPTYDIANQIAQSGLPHALRTLCGGILAGGGVLIGIIVMVFEWTFTYDKLAEVLFKNIMFWGAIFFVGLALIVGVIFYVKCVKVYWKYRDVVRVSLAPIAMDVLVLIIWFWGFLLYQ